MKRDLRIVFMGTPEFAVATLKALLENQYHVVGVITAPDKPAGRGQKLHQSAVKQFALEHNLKVLQPTNLKSESFLEELKALNPNLQIVVAFRMLPEVVWKLPEYGTFNLHASLLPDYRGAAPINWSIINGETKTGATTFFIDDKIDTGAIIRSKETPIKPEENAGSLHDRLMDLGSQLVIETVQLIENGTVETTPQPPIEQSKTAYKLNKENCKLSFNKPLDQLYNQIRGLSPYPAAWCTLINGDDQLDIKIYQAEKEITEHKTPFGTLIWNKKSLKVAVEGGYLKLLELQLPGKRKMDVKALLNGFQFVEGAKLA